MPKPLIVDAPYPSLDSLCCDPVSARIISAAYATPSGELNATLQYVYHSLNFAHCGYKNYADYQNADITFYIFVYFQAITSFL